MFESLVIAWTVGHLYWLLVEDPQKKYLKSFVYMHMQKKTVNKHTMANMCLKTPPEPKI